MNRKRIATPRVADTTHTATMLYKAIALALPCAAYGFSLTTIKPTVAPLGRAGLPMMDASADLKAEIEKLQMKLQIEELQKKLAASEPVTPPPVIEPPPVVEPPPVAMPPAADVAAQMDAVKAQIEMLSLKQQIEELSKAKAAPPAPVVVEPPPVESGASQADALRAQIEMLQKSQAAPVVPTPPPPVVEPPPSVASQADAIRRKSSCFKSRRPLQLCPRRRRLSAPPPAVDVASQADAIRAQIEALQRTQAPVTPSVPTIPSMPLEAPSTALSIPPPPVVEAAVAKTAAFGELFGIPYLGVALPLLIVPLAYFGGPAFVDFINKRYDELQSGEQLGRTGLCAARARQPGGQQDVVAAPGGG